MAGVQRLRAVNRHLLPQSTSDADAVSYRVLACSFSQEIASMNPVPSTIDDFGRQWGEDISYEGGYLGGAQSIFDAHPATIDLVKTYSAGGPSAGVLEQRSFEMMAAELTAAVKDAADAGAVDGVFFAQHGAMGASVEHDPEGFVLEELRKIVGPRVPIVITLDLHGIVTPRMCRVINGLAALHTYPHIDAGDTGRRAAGVLCRLMDGELSSPMLARVRVPMLLRGNELITEPHAAPAHIKTLMGVCLDLEARDSRCVSADLMWGNPFTDVPELGCEVLICMDGQSEDELRRISTDLAQQFWDGREIMQAALILPEAAVVEAARLLGSPNPKNTLGNGIGTVVLSDASDATSSGATGNSNFLLRQLLEQGYGGSVLFPIACPPSAALAAEAGIGATITVQLGGSLDPRYAPLSLEVEVLSLSTPAGKTATGSFGGQAAVLRHGEMVISCFTKPPGFHVRACFDGMGLMAEDFDLVVIKTPHAQPEMYDDWCLVRTLRHTIAKRPIYPLEGEARRVESEQGLHERTLGEDFAWTPEVEMYPMIR